MTALTGFPTASAGSSGLPANTSRLPRITESPEHRGGHKTSAEQTTTVVIGFDRARETEVLAAIAASGAKVTRKSKAGCFAVVRVPGVVSVTGFLGSMSLNRSVRFAEPEGEVHATLVPNDPRFAEQWNMTKIGAPDAWDLGRGDSGVTIAVVDTGVDLLHPDLVGRIDSVNDRDFVNADSVAQDDNGHGTHVAGIVGATTDNAIGVAGVANMCTILPVKVLRADGGGTASGVADGVRWAADKGARVINLSLGTSTYSTALHEAVQYAVSKDCVVVAATGNDARGSVLYPARLPGVIAVGSTTSSDGLSSFSNYGPEVDISAPGTSILSTLRNSGYGVMSGTSMATPHVAGVLGLLRSRHPLWARFDIEQQLLGSAKDLGAPGQDAYFGYGRLDAKAAAESTYAPSPPEFDDDIPGATLRSSPVHGDVAAGSDTNDVFWIDLQAGEMLVASLTSLSDNDFDLHLFGPDAHSVTTDTPVAESVLAGYPEILHFPVTTSGRYYIDVEAFNGEGFFTLDYAVRAVGTPADDDIPGIAIPASPVVGDLNVASDTDDVFAVRLAAGERLNVSMTGAAGTDFDAYLFGPAATSVLNAVPLASAGATTYPDTFSFIATEDGTYYLDAFASTGSGAYELSYHVSAAGLDVDGEIPGIPLVSHPQTDTLDAATDVADVFAFYVSAGQEVSVRLEGTPPANLDLFAFDPGTVSADTDNAFGSSTGPGASEVVTFTSRIAGIHYVACRAVAGAGEYSIDYSVTGDIPGVALPPSPASGELAPLRQHQVYRVDLRAGEHLYLGLSAVAGTDFDLRLFGPEATSISQESYVVARSDGDGSNERILFAAPRTGTYFVDVSTFSGYGAFTLVHGRPSVSASVTVAASQTVAYGGTSAIIGQVAGPSGPPVRGRVLLQRTSAATPLWIDIDSAETGSDGAYAFSVRPVTRTDYRVVFTGDQEYVESMSPVVAIAPRVLLSNPVAPSFMLQGRAAIVSGTLKPEHTTGTRPVRVYRYRYTAGHWARFGYVVARATADSGYSVSVSLPYRGSWRLRAYAPADEEHAASWSAGYDYVRVGTRGDRAVTAAMRLVGAKFKRGGTGPSVFDSSGFVRYVYSGMGVKLPRTAAMQARTGTAVRRSRLRPGDLVFFHAPARHVGIYVGNGRMIDCDRPNGSVQVRRIYSSYAGARRVW